MEFEVQDMTNLPKFWVDFITNLTDKSKDLLLIELGIILERQRGVSGLERQVALYKEQFNLREKKRKENK